MSAIAADAVREASAEDLADLAALEERKDEMPIPYEKFLSLLKADGAN